MRTELTPSEIRQLAADLSILGEAVKLLSGITAAHLEVQPVKSPGVARLTEALDRVGRAADLIQWRWQEIADGA